MQYKVFGREGIREEHQARTSTIDLLKRSVILPSQVIYLFNLFAKCILMVGGGERGVFAPPTPGCKASRGRKSRAKNVDAFVRFCPAITNVRPVSPKREPKCEGNLSREGCRFRTLVIYGESLLWVEMGIKSFPRLAVKRKMDRMFV